MPVIDRPGCPQEGLIRFHGIFPHGLNKTRPVHFRLARIRLDGVLGKNHRTMAVPDHPAGQFIVGLLNIRGDFRDSHFKRGEEKNHGNGALGLPEAHRHMPWGQGNHPHDILAKKPAPLVDLRR